MKSGRLARLKKKQAYEKKRDAEMPVMPVKWPKDPYHPTCQEEAVAVTIHPMWTGVGMHKRVLADEDWVFGCLGALTKYGYKAFANGMLKTLQMTQRYSWTTFPPATDLLYEPAVVPIARNQFVELPKPQALMAYSGLTRGELKREHVMGIYLNPCYAGVRPFTRVISDRRWIEAFALVFAERDYKQCLVDFLHILRSTYGAYGYKRATPLVYNMDEEGALQFNTGSGDMKPRDAADQTLEVREDAVTDGNESHDEPAGQAEGSDRSV